MFEELKISEAKSDLGQMFTPASQNKQGPSKRGLASKKKEKEILPPRKSSRISGGLVPRVPSASRISGFVQISGQF